MRLRARRARGGSAWVDARGTGWKARAGLWVEAARAGKPVPQIHLFLRCGWPRHRTGAAEVVYVRGAVCSGDGELAAVRADGQVAAVRGDGERVNVVHLL